MLLLGLGIRMKEERRNNGKRDWKRKKKMEGGRVDDREKKEWGWKVGRLAGGKDECNASEDKMILEVDLMVKTPKLT